MPTNLGPAPFSYLGSLMFRSSPYSRTQMQLHR